MIDLEKVINWFCLLTAVWLVGWLSHLATMKAVSEEINTLVPTHMPAPVVHENTIPFPGIKRMSQLDSIAFCHALITRTSND